MTSKAPNEAAQAMIRRGAYVYEFATAENARTARYGLYMERSRLRRTEPLSDLTRQADTFVFSVSGRFLELRVRRHQPTVIEQAVESAHA